MLKSELIRPRIRIHDGQVSTRPIKADYRYLAVANELTSLFKAHIGNSRAELTTALREYEGDRLDYPIIRGLAAVLEARCTFASPVLNTNNETPLKPPRFAGCIISARPVTRQPDLFNQTKREQVIAETATTFGLTETEIEIGLFADLAEEQILLDTGESITPGDLIARYNLELARGLLYWAREVRITVRDNYKDIFKYIKLFKLMYTIREAVQAEGYHITLHGPISPFVKSTIRYGVQFAKFLPAPLLCGKMANGGRCSPPQSAQPRTASLYPG